MKLTNVNVPELQIQMHVQNQFLSFDHCHSVSSNWTDVCPQHPTYNDIYRSQHETKQSLFGAHGILWVRCSFLRRIDWKINKNIVNKKNFQSIKWWLRIKEQQHIKSVFISMYFNMSISHNCGLNNCCLKRKFSVSVSKNHFYLFSISC